MANSATMKQKELFGHPVGLYVLFFTEMWERFSYYGMRAILVLYMISSATGENPGLGWSNSSALALYGWYTMLVYVMSIPGGILADKYIGQKKAVLIGGLILVAGHSVLAITAPWAFYTGLGLIVLGVGGLKPNISTLVGGLYKEGDEKRDSGFTIFYIGINIGAFLAAIIVGAVGEKIGWHYGFGLAGFGMLLGQIVFMLGQKHLVGIGDAPNKKSKSIEEDEENTSLGNLFSNLFNSPLHLLITIFGIIGSTIFSFYKFEGYESYAYGALFSFLFVVAGLMMMIYKDINKIEKDRFVVLLVSFLIIIVFWGAFEQAGGLLNIYTDVKIDREVGISVLHIIFYGFGFILTFLGLRKLIKKQDTAYLFLPIGLLILIIYTIFKDRFTDPYEIPTSVFQSVNALFIIIFGTIVSAFWIWWQHKGKESSSLFKMAVGTIIMGAGFLFMAKASNDVIQYGDKAALILLILAYLLHTIGELCASPVALSFITKVAPVKYVSIMMGVYFAATGLGNKLAGSIGEASQAESISVSLIANPADKGIISDNIFDKGDDFELVGTGYLLNEDIVFDSESNLTELIDINNSEQLKKYLLEENATKENPQTVIARFSYDRDKKEQMKSDNIGAETSGYSGQIEVFENQNKREFKTYIFIFIITSIFGILLLLFIKKLKKLTRGAEDIKGNMNDEAEGFELADN